MSLCCIALKLLIFKKARAYSQLILMDEEVEMGLIRN